MTLGIFGGSFDPPHICHVLVCQYVLSMHFVDRILVIPSFSHPFSKDQAPFEHRLAMTRMAMAGLGSAVEVSDIEATRDGYSYTVDTLRQLRPMFPSESMRLIIGSDILDEVDRWKDFDEVKRLAPPLIIPRGLDDAPGTFTFPPLSSTQIRAAMKSGQDVSSALQPLVLDYIARNGLYLHG